MPLIGVVEINLAAEKMVEKKDKDLKSLWEMTMASIIAKTPVDTGATRSNWFYKVGSASTKEIKHKSSAKGIPMPSMPRVEGTMFNKTHYLTNNTIQAPMLEFGGYVPKNSKKVVGGFSHLAPKGWVRKRVLKLRQAVKKL